MTDDVLQHCADSDDDYAECEYDAVMEGSDDDFSDLEGDESDDNIAGGDHDAMDSAAVQEPPPLLRIPSQHGAQPSSS